MNETPEQDQLYTLQSWWQRYGTLLIVIVALGGSSFVGWDQWQLFQQRKILAASDIYQRILLAENDARLTEAGGDEEEEEIAEDEEIAEEEEIAEDEEIVEDEEMDGDETGQEDAEDAAEQREDEQQRAQAVRRIREQVMKDIERLREEYPDTSYAHYATFLQVRYEVAAGRLARAEELLEWLRVHGRDEELIALAVLRLARVLHALGRGEQAINMLRNEPSRSFTPMFRELIGDIFWDYGQGGQALQEYELAQRLYQSSIRQAPPSLIMKMQELEGLLNRQ